MNAPSPSQPSLLEHAEQSISVGSKSFAAAARLFDPATRRSAVMLYAWCRHCDDVIDGQVLGFDAQAVPADEHRRRLGRLYEQTRAAYAGMAMSEPAFAAFQEVARRHAIPQRDAFDHLEGFAMDVQGQIYQTLDDTLRYCYHVAGVVGLMMARVMGVHDEATLDRACDLGIAFQLTNIARDIVEDAQAGRCYLPRQWLHELHIAPEQVAEGANREALAVLSRRLVALAEPYYMSASAGIARLPLRSAWAVGTARNVYRQIGVRVDKLGAQAWDARVSTSKADKLRLVLQGGISALSARGVDWPPRDPQLFQRPSGRPDPQDRGL
ncbi:15-cis-phytoene synthase CrtB [Pseudomonas sp. HR96]|uniref:15-cis-phytoene synthase CrtB n=1 Tax=Pseudomonas sp. HR96 TaxID=1027966 RepID=UPI002A758BBD|nr:15-cis-phytoene synthase CrtB [Pseudomonas sp. HR96]WPO98034.1 15-cis-phytoene synthase CrtB [Pseudomonas sp. HR96]